MLDGAHVVTMDAQRTEHASGHVVVQDGRVVAVAAGPAPDDVRREAGRVVHATGCVVTPGFVNTHQHLYQWATRGHAVDLTLFEWLVESPTRSGPASTRRWCGPRRPRRSAGWR